jgi:hypothetical protein
MEASLGDPAGAKHDAAALREIVASAHSASTRAAAIEAVYRRALHPGPRSMPTDTQT